MSLREKILWFGQERLQKTIIAAVPPVIMGVGIIFSWSRTGVFVFLMALLTMIVLVTWAGRGGADADSGGSGKAGGGAAEGGKRRSRRLIRTVFAGVAAIVLALGISPLIERFSADRVLSEGRPLLYKFTGDLIRAFPLSGVGLGCYLYGYNMFETEYTPGRTTHAHNDYLEVLAESGLNGGVALIGAGIVGLAVMAAGWLRRRDNFVRGVVLGCIAGIAGIMIHSFTDYSLRMPANAIYLVAIYALGFKVVKLRRVDWGAEAEEAAAAEETEGGGAGRTGVFKAAGWAAGWAVGLVAFLVLVVKENMGFVGLGEYEAARAGLARDARSLMSGFAELDRLLGKAARWSSNPRFSEEQGRLYIEMAIAENESDAPGKRDAYLDRAEEAIRRRIAANPADAMAYYDMSRVYLLYNYPLLTYQDAVLRYTRRALDFKPADRFLNVDVVYRYCVLWDGLSEDDKAWMFGRMRTVWPVNEEKFYPGIVDRWRRETGDLGVLKDILRSDTEVWGRAARFFPK